MKLKQLHITLLGLLLFGITSRAQETELPADFRQHNLTAYNSSLFNPVFSLDRNQPQSLAFWSRWQWQMVDGDPTTFFLNYSRKINESMAGGVAFFQHNTGVFLNRGGVLNYAFSAEIAPGLDFAAGLNIFAYQRQLADDRFQINPDIEIPGLEETNDFIVQIAPGMQLNYGPVNLGVVVENLLEYNLSTSENQITDSGNIFIAHLGARIPVNLFDNAGSSYFEPMVYVKRLPDIDNQVGIITRYSAPRFWVQGGYNSFYGVSGGIGGRFFKSFSIGALIEYGTQGDLQDQDPTFELITAFNFGSRAKPEEKEMSPVEEEPVVTEETKIEKEKDQTTQLEKERAEFIALQKEQVKEERTSRQERKRQRDSLRAAEKMKVRLAEELEQQRLDSIAYMQREAARKEQVQKRLDSIQKREAALKELEQKRLDSIRQKEAELALAAQKEAEKEKALKASKEEVKPQKGEVYEEAVNEEGLSPGFYLIANVFATKRYYEAFMKSLSDRGLNPKSFYRAKRKWNYVYLGKYNTMNEARRARDSRLNGQYADKLWIFRVVVRE